MFKLKCLKKRMDKKKEKLIIKIKFEDKNKLFGYIVSEEYDNKIKEKKK